MDRRKRMAALGGSTAAIASSGALMTRHNNSDTSDFLFGLALGMALAILIATLFMIRRGDKFCARG